MHKANIDALEDMLINQEKYKKQLKFREMEIEDTIKEVIPKSKQDNDIQDPRTIRAGGTVSTVENKVIKYHSDVQYQMLYSIVHNTPKFIDSLTDLERIIYDYKYRDKDITVNQWEHIASLLDNEVKGKDRSIGKTTTLKIRNRMLERLANCVGYPLM